MPSLRNNYERLLLVLASLLLIASAYFVFSRATAFHGEYSALVQSKPAHSSALPGQAGELGRATSELHQPPQWTYSGRSGLFVPEKHFIGPDGQPTTLKTTEVHAPVPNEWFDQFGLPIADADVLEQDGDGDGFNNLEEWQGHTDPTDKASHPNYLTKLKLKSFKEEPFRLVFASRTGNTFGINTIDLEQPTQFLKVGDTIAGTQFRILVFKEKYKLDRYGTRLDVSELVLENMDTFDRLVLVKEQVATSPSSLATFVYSWKERREFTVKKGDEFSLPPLTQIKYKLSDVQPNRAVLESSEAPETPIEIGLLAP